MSAPHPVPALTPVYRVARLPDVWVWPDWAYVQTDGTWGNRYDDPKGEYRVLYACTERIGGFLETLARFRPDLDLVAGLAGIPSDPADSSALQPGEVPRSWVHRRGLGQAGITGADFVDLGHSTTLAWLRSEMAARVAHFGLGLDLDAATIRMSVPRAFTQELSRRIYELSTGDSRAFGGIAYGSRLGDELTNWAIFEPAGLDSPTTVALEEGDADLHAAFDRLGLTLVDNS